MSYAPHILKNPYATDFPLSGDIILTDLDDTLIDTQAIKKEKEKVIDALYKKPVYMDTYYKAKALYNGNYTISAHIDLLKSIHPFPESTLHNLLSLTSDDILNHIYSKNIQKLESLSQTDHEILILTIGDITYQTFKLKTVFPLLPFIPFAIIVDFPKEFFFRFDFIDDYSITKRLKQQKTITYYNDKQEENDHLASLFPHLLMHQL